VTLEVSAPQPASVTVPPASRRSILNARGLSFSYDGRTPVLRNITLDIEAACVTMVLGRSGSGKTTLLKLLAGLLPVQQGQVTLAGCLNVHGRRAAGRIAYVPQTLGLVRSMSALDNALTGALSRIGTLRSLAHSFPRPVMEEAKETLFSLGLGAKLHEPVYRLSGGQRQRVAIARALMQKPALILADEFVSQLDPVTAEEILDWTRRMATAGVGLLVTTHETDVVEAYADRIVVMRNGEVTHDAPGGSLDQREMLRLLR